MIQRVVELRSSIVFAVFVALFAGCKQENVHHPDRIVRQWQDHHLNPIPPGEYDAIFECYDDGASTNDSLHYYNAEVLFPIGALQRPGGAEMPCVRLDGNPVGYGQSKRILSNRGKLIVWEFSGSEDHPSITHTIVRDSSLQFLAPDDGDSISLSEGFEIRYRAPKTTDSVLIHIACFGSGILKHDTAKILETGQSYYRVVPNTGIYIVPPLAMSQNFKSFDADRLLVNISAGKGDTVHVGNCIYGFITESHVSHTFKLKR